MGEDFLCQADTSAKGEPVSASPLQSDISGEALSGVDAASKRLGMMVGELLRHASVGNPRPFEVLPDGRAAVDVHVLQHLQDLICGASVNALPYATLSHSQLKEPGTGDEVERYEFKPNWELTTPEKLVVALTLAIAKHAPECGGFTDEELCAVSEDVLVQLRERDSSRIEEQAASPRSDEVSAENSSASLTHHQTKAQEIINWTISEGTKDFTALHSAIFSALSEAYQLGRRDAVLGPATAIRKGEASPEATGGDNG